MLTMTNNHGKAYLVGGGLVSLAAAAFMIRDCAMSGSNISIFESLPLLGGSLDAGGTSAGGYSMRGGLMLTTDNYECTWDLFKSIPSLDNEGMTVYDETVRIQSQTCFKFHGEAGRQTSRKGASGVHGLFYAG